MKTFIAQVILTGITLYVVADGYLYDFDQMAFGAIVAAFYFKAIGAYINTIKGSQE